ncbi:MBL fold metallo-hydrolase [Anaeromicropila populeti]|uniref:Glyoxylase, beta-lactamase superfamily II n=1 Tax=Anaeromicropila populeti TaxID=37658 RepID=A0A1I6IRA9_9FIRM|nr:MBL fold metallo-hydrolase [Anaeromicropila populeti]SFR69297.1 Glyoxylase, beta-lactamase superfamily II [Anaeromicropila populeti]
MEGKRKMGDILRVEPIEIKLFILGMVQTNCFIVSHGETKKAIVIDPADQFCVIDKYLKDNSLKLEAILLTHGHFDHILAASELKTAYHAPIYCHAEEKEIVEDSIMNCSGMIAKTYSVSVEHVFRDNEMLHLIDCDIKVLHTPGHTKGSVCFFFEQQGVLFSGDTLFLESVGRTDLPTGNSSAIVSSINKKLFGLEEKTIVLPGHGDSTTIGYEKKNNPYVNGFDFN